MGASRSSPKEKRLPNQPPIGTIAWHDLTNPDAKALRDFYRAVMEWEGEKVAVGGYDDYVPKTATGESVAGICHARDVNADVPLLRLLYVVVAKVEDSAARCRDLGGEILDGPRNPSAGRFNVIRDPAGATWALWQST